MGDRMTVYMGLSVDIVPGEYARVIQVNANGDALAHQFRSGYKAIFTKGLGPIYPIDEAKKVLQEVLDDPGRKLPEEHYMLDPIGHVDEKRLMFLQSEIFGPPKESDIF